jgi:hypothetical protein
MTLEQAIAEMQKVFNEEMQKMLKKLEEASNE